MMKLIKTFPEPASHVEAKAKARKEAQENSRLMSSEEKEQRAENTSRTVRKALLNGSARIGQDTVEICVPFGIKTPRAVILPPDSRRVSWGFSVKRLGW
jgi:hypothetical protein